MDEAGLCVAGTANPFALCVITLSFKQSCLGRRQ